MPRLSVIVCTHAPQPSNLQRVLQALSGQDLDKSQWELLLIDNASPQPLRGQFDLSWHARARHVREDALGLTPARLRGIRETVGELLMFVDDDNVLAADYLRTALTLCDAHPQLGVLGAGRIEPEFACAPARELRPYLPGLALRSVASARWGNSADDRDTVPWGPGLCVKRPVAEGYPQLLARLGASELVDRRGETLFGNGDVAFSWSAVVQGQGFGVFPALRVLHLIPEQRVSADYLLRLARDSGFSNGVLGYLWAGAMPGDSQPTLERWARLALHGLRRGRFAARHRRAAQQGAQLARAYIHEHRLRPMERERG